MLIVSLVITIFNSYLNKMVDKNDCDTSVRIDTAPINHFQRIKRLSPNFDFVGMGEKEINDMSENLKSEENYARE